MKFGIKAKSFFQMHVKNTVLLFLCCVHFKNLTPCHQCDDDLKCKFVIYKQNNVQLE